MLTYLTPSQPFSYEIPKIKRSKFIWYLFPITPRATHPQDQIQSLLEKHRKTYFDATHHCYAYRIWTSVNQDLFWNTYINPQYTKANDDGEPTNTAGKPILSVLEGAQLHNVLLIVTRYFGGTLLGVGGLIQAYTETAKQTITNAPLINAEITKTLEITYAYDKTAQISHLISKYQAKILAEERGEQVKQTLEVNYDFYEKITQEISLI